MGEEAEVVVKEVIKSYAPGCIIKGGDRLIEDLGLLSDDFTEMALRLERKFKFRADRKKWALAFTVDDVVRLVSEHVGKL